MHSALSVANAFIKLSLDNEKPLSHLQIQKLVYITQGYYLAINDEPLFEQDIMAWPYGPVTPLIYKKLKKFGKDNVTEEILLRPDDELINDDSFEKQLIDAVFKKYSSLSGGQLSTMTHKANTPWAYTWHTLKFSPIPHDLIKEHYKELLGR